MSQDTKTRPQKSPEKKIGPFASGIGVAIWLNEGTGEDGSVRFFRSVTINPRRYLDSKSGQWKDAASYQPSDLPALLFCQLALQTIPPVGASNDTILPVDVLNGSV